MKVEIEVKSLMSQPTIARQGRSLEIGSPNRDRTCSLAVNCHTLYY